ncbi:MAG: hypothetical protein KC613_16550, partial [Myxococcales bacterium]|nr:hypothetical protein [Myxococcales bacterium]
PDIDTDVQAAIDRLRDHLATGKPWIGIEDRADDVAAITTAYAAVRRAILAKQGQAAEAARERLKARKDYRKLDPHESNQVLRPISQAEDAHGEDAVHPDLDTLTDQFGPKLESAVEQANDLLDRLLEQKRPVIIDDGTKAGGDRKGDGPGTGGPAPPPPVRFAKVRIGLRHQTVESLDDLDTLLADLRERVKAELGPNTRVRLV